MPTKDSKRIAAYANSVAIWGPNYQRNFAEHLARTAGSMMKGDFAIGVKSTLKTDDTKVTRTDIRINDLITTQIRRWFPEDNILSEEGSYLKGNSRFTWVCDPLDGTLTFTMGVPTSVFSLALTKSGKPIVGVIYDPFTDRMFSAGLGDGATLNGERILVSKDKKLKGTTVSMGIWKDAQFNMFPIYEKLVKEMGLWVLSGPIAYQSALLACGQLSAYVSPVRMPYDSAASKIIIEEAGGKVTSMLNKEQRFDQKIQGVIMSNGLVHEEVVKLVGLARK